MRNLYKKAIKKRICEYVLANYEKMDGFDIGECPFNYKCHINAVNAVKRRKADSVVACVAIQKGEYEPVVHFVNQKKNGKYEDNTWGWICSEYDYYFVRTVQKNEYENIGNILLSMQQSLVKQFSNSILIKILLIKNFV